MNSKSQYDMAVFTAPSGAGKTTIVRHILSKYPELFQFSVSVTTRQKRAHEVDGVDYYFISEEEFRTKIDQGEFIEWEEVYENQYYGTLYSEIDRIKDLGRKIIFDIDVHGAGNIKSIYGEKCLTVFVKPPSFVQLVKRLTNRNTESEDSFKKRIKRIKRELLFENSFDLILLNDVLADTYINAEKLIEDNFIL